MAVIRIKTAEEFRDGYVTIEIVADDHEVVQVRERLTDGYDPDKAVGAMTGNYLRAKKRIEELEREARATAVDMDSLRKQLADETKRADKWGMTAARNHAPDGVYAREQNLASQLGEKEQAVRELREVATHLQQELDRAADNFKISQDKNRDLKAELDQVRSDRDIQKKERVANREWAKRAEKRVQLMSDANDAALDKLGKIRQVVGANPALQRLREVKDILDEA